MTGPDTAPGTAPVGTTSPGTAPGGTRPDGTAPGERSPDGTAPGEQAPDGTVSGGTAAATRAGWAPSGGGTRLGPVVRAAAAAVARDRTGLAMTGLFYLLVTFVLATLWARAADSGGGSVAGYRSAALVWYVAATEAATMGLSTQRMIEGVGDDIASGRVEAELLRPARPLAVRLATQLGAAGPRVALCAALGVGLAWIRGGAPPNPAALALAAPALALAVAVNITAAHAFAAASFWLREARTAWFVYQKLIFLLGGMLLPLEVLPPRLAAVARVTPFAAQAYVPGRLASGHLEPGWLGVQVAWLVALAWLADRLFQAGEARFVRGRP